jgi:non-ribosomal peptide synthetase component E (peptide arylation enzyme)
VSHWFFKMYPSTHPSCLGFGKLGSSAVLSTLITRQVQAYYCALFKYIVCICCVSVLMYFYVCLIDEIQRQLQTCNAKAAVTTPQFLSSLLATKGSGDCPDLKSIIIIGEPHAECHTFSEMIKVDPTRVRFPSSSEINTLEDITLLPFSSGTTGLPKGNLLLFEYIPYYLVSPKSVRFCHFPRSLSYTIQPACKSNTIDAS